MEKDIDLKVKAQGPVGPQGPQGPQGARGDIGYNFYYSTYEAIPNQNSMYWTDLQPVANPPRVGEHVVMPSGKVYQITEVNNNASPKTYGIGEQLTDLHGIQGPKGDKGDVGKVDVNKSYDFTNQQFINGKQIVTKDELDVLADKLTQSMNTSKALGATVQNGLDALDQKIKQDGLSTQEVAGILANAATSKVRNGKSYATLSARLDDDEGHQLYVYPTVADMQADNGLSEGMIAQVLNYIDGDHLAQKFKIKNNLPSDALAVKLSNGNYATEVTINRPFAPKIVAQPEMFIVNNDLEKMKQCIDGRIYTGYESFVVDVHLNYGNGGFTTSEDLSKLLEAFQYAKNQGYSITALKIHYTGVFDDTSVPAYCSYITSTVIPALKGLGFDKVCVLNERQETVTPWYSTYIPQFMGLITSIKALGYKVGISYENDSHITLGYSSQRGLMESLDWIGCNLYPTIGAYGELTGVDDVKSAFDDAMDSLYMVQQLGKPIIITETGIRPYAQYFGSPSNYGYDNSIDDDYTVFTRYFEGAFKSKIRSVASEIWDWHAYDTVRIPTLAQLIRQARGVI